MTVALGGNQTSSTVTDGQGNYTFSVAPGGTYIVTPSRTGYAFTPASRTVNAATGNQTANFSASLAMYTISGTVTLLGNALSGVTLALSGSQSGSALSDSGGNYGFSVTAFGTYGIAPSLAGYTFAPSNQLITNVSGNANVSFSALPNVSTISGGVKLPSGSGLGGVSIALSGGQNGLSVTDVGGNYSFTVVTGGTYIVTPSLIGYVFSPPSQTFSSLIGNQTANFSASLGTYTISNPGVYRSGFWFVDWNGNNQWDTTDAAHIFAFGLPGDLPILGDWNGDGRMKLGVYRNGLWFVDWNGNNQWDTTDAAHIFAFGLPGDLPVMGDWNGDGHQKLGVYRSGFWFVDWNGNNQWDTTDAAHIFAFGLPGDLPVVSHWDSSQQSTSSLYAPMTISQMETNVTTSLLLNGNAEVRAAAIENMARVQTDIMLDHPELRRQLSDMQRDVLEIESRPEVQDDLRRMRIEMERIRGQLPRE